MDNNFELLYCQKNNIEHRREFAQFFTPVAIAQFMSKWILFNFQEHYSILEPAFGLGVFSRALLESNRDMDITGFDVDPIILEEAQNIFNNQHNVTISQQDYILSNNDCFYDGIICNPPYFKFHDYDNLSAIATLKEQYHYSLSGFTNLYALFLLKSIKQLKIGGRCAYIVPSEFMNSDYGIAVKKYLLQSRSLRYVIAFDFEEELFDDAITTSCILLCSNQPSNKEVCFAQINKLSQLENVSNDIFDLGKDETLFKRYAYEELDPSIKWRNYYSHSSEKKYYNLVPFKKYGKVTRGIATGANNYFSFNEKKIIEKKLSHKSFIPCICHCTDIKTIFFSNEDFDKLAKEGKNVYLFDGQKDEKNEFVQSYLQDGICQGVNMKFLTASKTPWYALEKRLPPPIWVTVFNRDGMRFVRNTSKATNLTTFHSIYINQEYISYIDLIFAYFITPTAQAIFDYNRREYGNGLRKFEPNDINNAQMLDLERISFQDKYLILQNLDLVRKGIHQKILEIDSIIKSYVSEMSCTGEDEESTNDMGILVKELTKQYPTTIINHNEAKDAIGGVDANILVSLVKNDNIDLFLDGSAKIYYTGKKFPSTVALNKLYYFMPYIKGKGIKDLYYIKVARVGTRREGFPDNDPNDFRLVFEIEFVKQLFEDYKSIKLKIWETFTDTKLSEILKM